MKKTTFILVLFITANNSYAQDNCVTKLKDELLYGKVKSLTEISYTPKYVWSGKPKTDKIIYTFDTLGREITRSAFEQNSYSYYNSEGQLFKYDIYYARTGELEYQNEYLYENGNLVKHINKPIPMRIAKSSSDYDYFVRYYKYNEENKLIEKKVAEKRKDNNKEILTKTIKYQYDSNGDCILEEEYNYENKLVETKENTFENHKLIETFTWQLFEGENQYMKDTYTYNDDSTMRSHLHFVYMYNSKEEIVVYEETNYDYVYKKNKLIEYSEISTFITSTISYDLDKKGNWVKKTKSTKERYKKEEEETPIIRIYEYYDD